MAKWGTEDALDFDSSFTDMMRHAKETLMVYSRLHPLVFCFPAFKKRKETRTAHGRVQRFLVFPALPCPTLFFA
jgi:hypothetical protein